MVQAKVRKAVREKEVKLWGDRICGTGRF